MNAKQVHFGYAVEGYEIPWGTAPVGVMYDSERLPDPPRTVEAFVQWIKDSPGRFTYGAPPGFQGSMIVRYLCGYAMGGNDEFRGEFDQALFDERFPECWDFLNEIEPYLWRGGETYPQDGDMNSLFYNAEVDMVINYGFTSVRQLVDEGLAPETARPMVFEGGMEKNNNYIAIAYNAAHLPAALVTANHLAGLESQLYRMERWDAKIPWKFEYLPKEYQDRIAELEAGYGVYTLRSEDIPSGVGALPGPWLIAIEKGWEENVLRK